MNAICIITLILSFGLTLPSLAEKRLVLINQINESYAFCSKICQECNNLELRCSNLNLTSFKLIENPLPDTQRIVFTGNSISVIDKQIFIKERSNIKMLNLSNNNINSVNEDAFRNLPSLNKLILDKNTIDFRKEEKMKFLEKISPNLEFLSLSQNLIPFENEEESKGTKFNNLSIRNNLLNLKYLNLDNNFLTEINSNFFCDIPNLVSLNLESNNLKQIDLNVDCIHSLRLLNLKSNRFEKLSDNIITIFKKHKNVKPNFEVYLSENLFKCDCNLYEFYKFLKEEFSEPEISRVIKDSQNLKCKHPDSLHYSINKSIIESNLDRICGYPIIKIQEFKKKIDHKSLLSIKNKTELLTTARPHVTHDNISRLAVFLFCSLLMSATLILVMKLRFKKLWNIIGFKFYRRLNDANNPHFSNRMSFNEPLNNLARESENLDDKTTIKAENKKLIWLRLESLFHIFKKKRNLDYYRFDYQSTDSNKIYRPENRKSASSFFLKKNNKKINQTEMDVVPIISDDEETAKNICTSQGVLGVRII